MEPGLASCLQNAIAYEHARIAGQIASSAGGKPRNDPSEETVVCERIIAALSLHTRAASLLNAGVPPHVAQRYLGHLSPRDNNPASPGECITHGVWVGRSLAMGAVLRAQPPVGAVRMGPSDHKVARS